MERRIGRFSVSAHVLIDTANTANMRDSYARDSMITHTMIISDDVF